MPFNNDPDHSSVANPIAPVTLRGVGRVFGAARALAGVDLDLAAGDLLLLLGPNGAGKSTLLRLLAGLLRPSAGTVRFAGTPPAQAGPSLRTRLGYLGHRSQLHRDLSVREALSVAAGFYGLPPDRVPDLLERLDLLPIADRLLGACSRGQVQRAALARALLPEPDLLLLDEPTNGLDRDSVGRLRELLRERRSRRGIVVIATHDPGLFDPLAPRTLTLHAGRPVPAAEAAS